MSTKTKVLAKFFSIFRDYTSEFISTSSSPEDLLKRSEEKSLRYDFNISEPEMYALYGELSDAFSIDVGEFYEFISPTVGDLVHFIFGKIDVA